MNIQKLLFAALAAVPQLAFAQLSVTLTPSAASPQPVGTQVTWTASVAGASGPLNYQFSVSGANGVFNMIQDYSPQTVFKWTSLQEGSYQIKVAVIDSSGTTAATVPFVFSSRITGTAPVVSATQHPLVALYSAPPCDSGQVIVQFQLTGATAWKSTPLQTCQPGRSLNFYVAGMLPNSNYLLQQVTTSGSGSVTGPLLTFQTGTPQLTLPGFTLTDPPDANTSTAEGLVMSSFLEIGDSNPGGGIATDLLGNLLWYDTALLGPNFNNEYFYRPAPGGTYFSKSMAQVVREYDLSGTLVHQTTAYAVNLQLAALGRDQLSWFGHDALRLPNGHTIVMGYCERILTNVQGPGPVDVVGDLILDLNQNFQVAWSWSAFDFLDTSRKAVLGETCGPPACPLLLASVANDWTHGNSVEWLPDSNLLISLRHQDWVVKVDFRNGAGTGNVLWRLGLSGDFSIVSSDPYPWFSHQHGVEFDGTNYELFDNGNTRVAHTGPGDSRGQVFALNEQTNTDNLLLNADLGYYSDAWGNAQLLANGDYQFENGGENQLIQSQPIEVLPSGVFNYRITWQEDCYRSFRLTDLYSYPRGADKLFVSRLYLDLLSRPPDPSGLTYWQTPLNTNVLTRAEVATNFFGTAEFQNDAAFLIYAYDAVLGRDADYAGWLGWDQLLEQGSSNQTGVLNAFLGSPEYQQRYGSPDDATFVTLLYQNALKRAPDTDGLNYWVGALEGATGSALSRAQVANSFIVSPECAAANQNRMDVFMSYFGFLKSDPDPAGLSYWLGRVTGGLSLTGLIDGFIESPEYFARFT